MYRIADRDLQRFAEDVLRAAGLAPEDASAIAAGLVMADLRGVTSHGVFRLMQYTESVRDGQINPTPSVRVLEQRGATALVDADGGYGYRPTVIAMDLSIDLARSFGVGVVGVRNSHHFGAAAFYTVRAAEEKFIGICTTTTQARLAPPGAAEAAVGNNPISVGIPRRDPHLPIILDMALSEVALGKIRIAAAEGRSIPSSWGFDRRGRPTTNPAEVLAGGFLAPIGSYKGFGLSVAIEVLAGVLTESPFGLHADNHRGRSGGVGHLLMAINPALFTDLGTFFNGVEDLIEQIKSRPLAEGSEAIYLPGEIEWIHFRERKQAGVPVSAEIAEQLEGLADALGVERPRWLTMP